MKLDNLRSAYSKRIYMEKIIMQLNRYLRKSTPKSQLNQKVNELTNQGIVVQDPLKSRQEIISELISLIEITVLLKLKQSNDLLIVFNEKLNILPPKQLEYSKLQRNNIVLNQNYNLLRQKLEEAINVASQWGKYRSLIMQGLR